MSCRVRFLSVAAVIVSVLIVSLARADEPLDDGARLFKRCAACHSLEPGVNKVGPSLSGLVGQPSGSLDNYRYSSAMAGAGLVWDPDTLNEFLRNPRGMLPGIRMSFPGIRDDEDRATLVAWLEQSTAPGGSAMAENGMMGTDGGGGMMSQDGSGMMEMMPGTTGLMMPKMDAVKGKELFVTKGCVACHAVNGIGGTDAPALDVSMMAPAMNPFDLAAKMWRMAPVMIAAQEDELDGQILFTGDELANIVAFLHDPQVQAGFSEDDLTPEAQSMMMGHDEDEEHDDEDGNN